MAEIHGSEARLYLNGTDVSSSFVDAEAKSSRGKLDSTGFGDPGMTHMLAPTLLATLTANGMLDMVATPAVASYDALKNAAATIDGSDVIVLMARDTTLGDPGFVVYGSMPEISTKHPMRDIAQVAIAAQSNLGGAFTAALQPKGAVVAAGNGGDLDNLALSTNGGISSLQVMALTGTAPVITIKAQHAVTTTWVDLATHAAINTAGVTAGYRDIQTIAPGTTVNRHLRWILTVTSGSLTSITFAHQFARQ